MHAYRSYAPYTHRRTNSRGCFILRPPSSFPLYTRNIIIFPVTFRQRLCKQIAAQGVSREMESVDGCTSLKLDYFRRPGNFVSSRMSAGRVDHLNISLVRAKTASSSSFSSATLGGRNYASFRTVTLDDSYSALANFQTDTEFVFRMRYGGFFHFRKCDKRSRKFPVALNSNSVKSTLYSLLSSSVLNSYRLETLHILGEKGI